MTNDAAVLREREERQAHDVRMEHKGQLIAPYGGWVTRKEWIAHIRKLRKRAEQNPQWAP